MVASGDKVSIDILVVTVVEETIWDRCTLSFRSLLVDMVYDLRIGSNEQYSRSISGMQPKVHVFNSDADLVFVYVQTCLLYTSPSPRDGLLSRMPSSA